MMRPTTMRPTTMLSLALVALIASAGGANAQGYPFSQRGTVSQRVAFTDLSLEYGRPTARGRALFGALVPWDSVWHPGADSATQLTITREIALEGRAVPAGTYTLWLIPRQRGPWTLIVNRTGAIQHTPYPGPSSDLMRIDVTPEQLSHAETMAWSFPTVLRDEAQLRLHWGTTAVTVKFKAPYRPLN
jgi:Protein of unknown function (DUF2911)